MNATKTLRQRAGYADEGPHSAFECDLFFIRNVIGDDATAQEAIAMIPEAFREQTLRNGKCRYDAAKMLCTLCLPIAKPKNIA